MTEGRSENIGCFSFFLLSLSLSFSCLHFLANKRQIEHRFRFNSFRSTSFLLFYCVWCSVLVVLVIECLCFVTSFCSGIAFRWFLSNCACLFIFIPAVPVLLLFYYIVSFSISGNLVRSHRGFSRRCRRHPPLTVIKLVNHCHCNLAMWSLFSIALFAFFF